MKADRFIELLAPLLKDSGFRKEGSTWRKDLGESVGVANVQKSQWGGDHYLNVGIYLKSLGTDPSPAENKCHVRDRLSLDEPKAAAQAISNWLLERSTIERLKSIHSSGKLSGLIHKSVRELLGP